MKCLKMVVYSSLFAALSPSYAAEQTLAVSLNGGNIEVSVPANAYDDTSKLYVVWGVADHGAEISAWPLANRRACDGALSASAATYQISADGIPAGSVVRAIVTSDVRLIDGYVSLGNEQYVNTGIKGNEAYGVDFKFRCTGGENWHSVIGSELNNFTIGKRYTNNEFYLRYRGEDLGLGLFKFDDVTIPHRFRVVNKECWLDDKQMKTGLAEGSIGTDGKNILVGTSSSGDGTSGKYCYGEWHYVRIFNANGGDMLHLVAAVRGNTSSPEGVFYDKVTGKVFANAGTGTLGCDTSAAVTETIPFTTACSAALSMAKTARWTGAGDRGNVNDPANWSCTDAAGETVVSAPDAQTLVKIEGSTTFNIPAGQMLLCSSLELNDVQLAGDCDWSGIDAVNAFAPVYALQYLDAPKDAYIDTGFVPNSDTRVVFEVTVRGALESWFGVSGDDSGNWWKKSVFAVSNDGGGIYSGFGDSGGTFAPVAANGRHTIDFYKGELKVDGVKHTTHSAQTLSLSRSLYLFADNKASVNTKRDAVRFHSCRIYDNGTLVRDYVPVKRGEEVCLFDKVNREYARNIGSGAFAAGPLLGIDFYSAKVVFDSIVDLAGHKLTLAHVAGTGEITDTVGGGELRIDVPAGILKENTGLSFSGSLKLVKTGAGTFTASKTGQTYTGGTVVMNGLARSGVAAGPWGPSKALVKVADTGAAFDWNGVVSASATPYSFDIKGTGIDNNGAIVFTPGEGAVYTAYCLADLALSGDALVVDPSGNDENRYCGFIQGSRHVLTLNGNTLTVKAGSKFNFMGVTAADTGTIAFTTDETDLPVYRMASFWGKNSGEDNILTEVVLDVAANMRLNTDNQGRKHVVGTFIDRGVTGQGSQSLTVLDRFCPMTASLNCSVLLGDAEHLAPVLDLSGLSGPFSLPSGGFAMNPADGATIMLKMGRRSIDPDVPVVAWQADAPPASVDSLKFACGDGSRRYDVTVKDDGVYLKVVGFAVIVR